MKRRSGFSLIELMVSLAILSIVMVSLTYLFARQSRSYTVVEQVAEAQQTLRGIAGLIEREARTTGFMVPQASAFCGYDDTSGSDILFVTDSAAIDPSGQTKPEIGASVSPTSYDGTGSSETLNLDSIIVDGDAYYDTDGDGSRDSDFLYDTAGGGRSAGVIVVDRENPDRGSSCGFLTGLGSSSITVDFTLGGTVSGMPLANTSPSTTDLVAVPAHYYRVDANNQLMRDGMVLAQDVEDLQFALFYDVDGSGTVGSPSNELPGFSSTAPVYDPSSWNNELLREIRLAFVVRTQSEDRDALEDAAMGQSTFQAAFNRSDPGGSDGFRRRLHRLRVRPRNVGLR